MDRSNAVRVQWFKFVLAATLATIVLSGCDGDNGTQGQPGPVISTSATSLTISVDSVAINSAPVVNFTVTNEDGFGFPRLTTSDLRFTIAKLMPGAWQNYINTEETAKVGPGAGNTAVQATRENNGTLVDNNDGSYTYTFATDITNVTEPVAVTYDASATHRLAIQTRGSLPMVNAVYTFRPSDGATEGILSRDIVTTASCNECHNKLELHDARIDTQYCVVCHNPGSTDANSGNTVDFKVMIHKIHRGAELTVVQGADGETFDDLGTVPDETADNGEYAIWGFMDSKHDYSTVGYPQDIANCAKCHDGGDDATPQGDNWKTQLSMEACGSCHDDVDFSKDGSDTGANDPDGHEGGIVSDNSLCITCHSDGGDAGSVAESHADPVSEALAKFNFRILQICGQDVPDPADPDDTTPWPSCAGVAAVVKFEVTDPSGAATHGYGNKYDVSGPTDGDRDLEFARPGGSANASLNVVMGWMSGTSDGTEPGIDFTNEGPAADAATGNRPSRAGSINAITDAGITENPDGTFDFTFTAIPGTPTSGVIALEGHPKIAGTSTSIPVKGAVAYFGVNGNPAVERRVAVDVETKCDNCHLTLSLHGANRAENAQLCVICHNPRGTDVLKRPVDVDGLPDGSNPDGKKEESIDLKRLIHGIHAGAASEHGFRESGLGIQGRNSGLSNFDDYSHIRFPGILNDCETCHNAGTYELDGIWETPLQNGVLAVTMQAVPDPIGTNTFAAQLDIQTDDLLTTPTAAVCSSCHDSALSQAHMQTIGGARFSVKQSDPPNDIDSSFETCSVCHGPGRSADVEVVHAID